MAEISAIYVDVHTLFMGTRFACLGSDSWLVLDSAGALPPSCQLYCPPALSSWLTIEVSLTSVDTYSAVLGGHLTRWLSGQHTGAVLPYKLYCPSRPGQWLADNMIQAAGYPLLCSPLHAQYNVQGSSRSR